MSEKNSNTQKIVDIVMVALFAVIITVCSWISIPAAVPFTLQTFAIFCTVVMLGGMRGTFAIIIYILLGAIGIPVFSGFNGGFGALIGPTGGYIIGFVFTALIYWLITHFFGKKSVVQIIALLAGLLVCYAFGTAWFMIVYTGSKGAISLFSALGMCVFPFIIPDIIKLAVAFIASNRVSKYVKI